MEEYSVYEHVFPDGMKYIGISKDPTARWSGDGIGYMKNKPMYKAIEKYGWDHIQHNILESNLTRNEARKREMELISQADKAKLYNKRPGGEINVSLYSKHVNKMLHACMMFPQNLKPFVAKMLDLSDDEGWAYQVNLVDYVIRTECDGYLSEIEKMKGDSIYEVSVWFYYFSNWIKEPDKSILEIPLPSVWSILTDISKGASEQ